MNANHLNLVLRKLKFLMSILVCKIIPSHAKLVTRILNPTSTPSHHSQLSSYDRCIMPFVDVEAKECIEHISDKGENKGAIRVLLYMVPHWLLIVFWCINVCEQFPHVLPSMPNHFGFWIPKIPLCLHQFIFQT